MNKIKLRDIIRFWITTNKNLSRSWYVKIDPDDTWVVEPMHPRQYRVNARILIKDNHIKMHYDDDHQHEEKGCHTEILLAYDKNFFAKIQQWMKRVRR